MTGSPDPGDRAALVELARDAYIYGFPLVFNVSQVLRFVREGVGGVPPTPLNRMGHGGTLAGPADTFVSINNDTVYSIGSVDSSGGPVRLEVPDTAGRYYVLQFVDAWTNNFAYVGHRATGTGAGAFLLVPPGWSGEAPAGTRVIRMPTTIATVIGRWAVTGADDLPAVAALQNGLRLEAPAPGAGVPDPDPGVADDLAFFESLRVWMRAFPPAPRDAARHAAFAPLGLGEASSPYVDPDPALADALREGATRAREVMEAALTDGGVPRQNGWQLTYHAFDYNLDFFEVGALDDPRWKLDDGPARLLTRALAARGGLWGNHGYEAAYAAVFEDGDGAPLDGAHRYELRFATPPPVGAFWSVTMYDTPEFFLVENPIDRYSIGDRTPGLVTAGDGSLTITMQREAPEDPTARANWLPTPAGRFRPLLRMYEPDPAVADGGYVLPPVVRVD